MRARAIIEVALQKVKVLASGETADAADMKLALDALNALIEAWALSPQMILVPRLAGPFALTAGQGTYTIGPTGNFLAPRPASLVDSSFIRDNNGWDYPVRLLSFDDYADIGDKAAGGGAYWMRYSPSATDGTLTLYPAPIGGSLYLAAFGAFVQFPDFDTDVPMSPGYLRTLQFNLAVEIAEDFGRPISPGVARTAANSKRALKRANAIIPMARIALPGYGYGGGDPIGPHRGGGYGSGGEAMTWGDDVFTWGDGDSPPPDYLIDDDSGEPLVGD